MVDPRTLEKISISGADRTELLEYIDPGFVPRSYGGSDELEVGAAPEEVEFVAYATKCAEIQAAASDQIWDPNMILAEVHKDAAKFIAKTKAATASPFFLLQVASHASDFSGGPVNETMSLTTIKPGGASFESAMSKTQGTRPWDMQKALAASMVLCAFAVCLSAIGFFVTAARAFVHNS